MPRIYMFHNTRLVMKVNRLCTQAQFPIRVVPTPHEYSSECGMSIEVEAADDEAFNKLLTTHHVEYTAVMDK